MRRPLSAALLALAACAGAPPAPPPSSPSPAAPAIRTVLTARGKLVVDDGGRGGLPVLFVHGGGGDKGIWAGQLAHLRQTRRAIAVDLAGFGESEPPRDGNFSPVALGEDLGRVADALGVSRFVLVVHGFAGTVGISYASRHPLRVAGLFFVDADGGRGERPAAAREEERRRYAPAAWKQTVEERYAPLLADAPMETAERVRRILDRTSREAHLAAALAPLSFDPVAGLKPFKGPRFALAAPRRVLEGVQANVEGLPYRKEPAGSHWLMLDEPARVNAALDEFLAGLR